MVLTPLQKFLIIAFAGLVEGMALIWTGIKVNVLNLGMSQDVYDIGLTIISVASIGATGLLITLGLKATTSNS